MTHEARPFATDRHEAIGPVGKLPVGTILVGNQRPATCPASRVKGCVAWPSSPSSCPRMSSRSRSGSTTSPRTSCAPPLTSGTSARSSPGRSCRRRPRSGCTASTSWPTPSPSPTGLTLPVAAEELFWGDAGIGLAIFGSGLAAAGISGQRHARAGPRVGAAVLRHARRRAAGRLLRERARRRLRRVVAAHPGGLRRGDRRVGAQRHQGVDHQRRHRRRARGRRGRRSRR